MKSRLPLAAIAPCVLCVLSGAGSAPARESRPDAAATEPAPPRPPQLGGVAPSSRKTAWLTGEGKVIGPRDIVDSGTIWKGRSDSVARGYTFTDLRLDGSCALYNAMQAGATLSDTSFRRILMTNVGVGTACPKLGIRVRGPSNNLLFEDVDIRMTGVNTQPGDIPEGISLAGKTPTDNGANIIFRRVHVSGVQSSAGRFLNGDGIATEGRYSHVRYEDVFVEHNTDAGIDNKAASTTCARVKAAYNRRNIKAWYGIDCDGPVVSVEPGQPGSGAPAHIFVTGGAGRPNVFHFSRIDFHSSNKTPLVANGSPTVPVTVIIDSYLLDVPAGTPITSDPKGMMTVKWGRPIASCARLGPSAVVAGPGC